MAVLDRPDDNSKKVIKHSLPKVNYSKWSIDDLLTERNILKKHAKDYSHIDKALREKY